MSRPPIRDVFRFAHLGLEKGALACAAFSLMHATARADEPAPPETAVVDQWALPAGVQPGVPDADQTVRNTVRDDPWANPAAVHMVRDDSWSAPSGNQVRSGEQLHAVTPARQTMAAADQPGRPAHPANVLVMDSSNWNETPRGRSPGLIASNNAWRKRVAPDSAATIERDATKHNRGTQPAAVLKLDGSAQSDPWITPAAASKGADNAADWQNLRLASAHQPRSCNRDWSIFSGPGCPDSNNPADSAKGTQVQASGNTVRRLIAITPDGRWRAPLVIDAEASPRK